ARVPAARRRGDGCCCGEPARSAQRSGTGRGAGTGLVARLLSRLAGDRGDRTTDPVRDAARRGHRRVAREPAACRLLDWRAIRHCAANLVSDTALWLCTVPGPWRDARRSDARPGVARRVALRRLAAP